MGERGQWTVGDQAAMVEEFLKFRVEIVPLEAPPTTLQVTDVFGVPVTLALNCWLLPAVTVAEGGEMLTEIWTGGVELPEPPQPQRT